MARPKNPSDVVSRKITMKRSDWEAIQEELRWSSHSHSGPLLADCFRFWKSETGTLQRLERKLDLLIKFLCE